MKETKKKKKSKNRTEKESQNNPNKSYNKKNSDNQIKFPDSFTNEKQQDIKDKEINKDEAIYQNENVLSKDISDKELKAYLTEFISIEDISMENGIDIDDDNHKYRDTLKLKNDNKCNNIQEDINSREISYENIDINKIIENTSAENKIFLEMYFQKYKDDNSNLYRLPNLFVLYNKIDNTIFYNGRQFNFYK